MRINNYRYLINDNPMALEVHDLDNEYAQCQISEIQHYRFLDSNLESAMVGWINRNPQYDGCAHCLPHLHRK